MPHQDQIRIFWCISFASAQWHQNFTLLNTAWIEWIIFWDFLSIFGHFWSLFGNVTPPESQLEPLKMAVTSCFWWLSSQPPVTHDEHLIKILQYLEIVCGLSVWGFILYFLSSLLLLLIIIAYTWQLAWWLGTVQLLLIYIIHPSWGSP